MSFAYTPINIGTTSSGGTSGGATRGGLGATVASSGADYTSVGAAISGQQTIINVVGNVYEQANINLGSSGLNLFLYNGATVAMGTNSFSVDTGERLFVIGDGNITYSGAQLGALFNGSGLLYVEGIGINNTNNNAACLTNMDYARFDSVRFDGDVRICGDFNIYSDCIYRYGTVLFATSANKSAVHGAVLENVLIVDSGTNSVVSDILNG